MILKYTILCLQPQPNYRLAPLLAAYVLCCSLRKRMNSLTPMIVAIIVLTLVGCDDVVVDGSSSQGKVEVEEIKIPESFAEALDALDAMFSEEELETCRNDTVDLCHLHNQISMRLRNDWGLWGDSKLKVYFSERGITNSNWISVAIFESWIERLKTGSFDETAIIAKYAKFAETSAEQGGTGQPATRPESKSEGGDKPQPEAEGRSR